MLTKINHKLLVLAAEVLSEEVILKWYKEGHATKGKSIFLDQLKKFVEWLQSAEEGELIECPCLCLEKKSWWGFEVFGVMKDSALSQKSIKLS